MPSLVEHRGPSQSAWSPFLGLGSNPSGTTLSTVSAQTVPPSAFTADDLKTIATVIATSRHPEPLRKKGLKAMWHSLPASEPAWNALLPFLENGALACQGWTAEEALSKLVQQLFFSPFWREELISFALSAVINAHVLPDLLLAAERDFLGINGVRHQKARRALNEFEDDFEKFLSGNLAVSRTDRINDLIDKGGVIATPRAIDRIQSYVQNPEYFERIFVLSAIRVFIDDWHRPIPENRRPFRITRFYLREPEYPLPNNEPSGDCVPAHANAAQLALKRDIQLEYMDYLWGNIKHICLFDPELNIVFDVTGNRTFCTLEDLREESLIGPRHTSHSLRAFFAAHIDNLAFYYQDISNGFHLSEQDIKRQKETLNEVPSRMSPSSYRSYYLTRQHAASTVFTGSKSTKKYLLLLQELLKTNPRDISILCKAGEAFFDLGDYGEAEEKFREALKEHETAGEQGFKTEESLLARITEGLKGALTQQQDEITAIFPTSLKT